MSIPLPHHVATVGEILEVLWSDYYGAALFGDGEEIVRLPYKGCRLEIVASAESSCHELELMLPGEVIRYRGPVFFLDRFELPTGTTVGLWHLVGFKLRLGPDTIAPVPSEDLILRRARGVPPFAWAPGGVPGSGAAIGTGVSHRPTEGDEQWQPSSRSF